MVLTFAPFGMLHAVCVVLTALAIALPLLIARYSLPLARGVVVAQLAWSVVGAVLLLTERGTLRWVDVLPLHLCDLTLLITIAAYGTRNQLAYELAYFYGLAGSPQALLTPDIAGTMPLWRLAYFFGSHAAVIATVLWLTLREGMRPRRRAVWHAMAGLAVYTAVVGCFNLVAGTNYGYLCHKPTRASLLDYLGPWPWYIGAMGVMGLLCFWLLMLPFQKHAT